ncbi:MAG: hypothetical protein A2Y24_04470 [Clostridiales bacterium GWE2_32_10]|nr:MAG: hypothetical protein A2Y24_04470 [Clostridiales bacterium GWE2_32_10]
MDNSTKRLLEETSFLVIDFETVTPKGRPPEPIELGLIRISNAYNIDDKTARSVFIKPPEGVKLTSFDTYQTGITESDISNAESSQEVMRRLDNVCAQKDYVFIAQNAKYEANILSAHVDNNPNIKKTRFIDTILLAKKIIPGLPNYKLDTIADILSIKIPKDRHRALPDCILTAQIFIEMLELCKGKENVKYLNDLMKIAEIKTKYNQSKQISFFDL